jgi:alkylation response protein AidB-like acyl-CoA dehydrogenase
MNFDRSPGEKELLAKLAGVVDGLGDEPRRGLDEARSELLRALAALAPTGYLELPAAGRGGGPALVAAMEAVGARSASRLVALESSARLFGRAVAACAGEDAGARWLVPLRAGAAIGAVGLSEASTNVVNDPLATRGERDGGDVVVSGRKSFVCNAPVADWIALVGALDGGPALFVVERGAAGLAVGDPAETTGLRGATFAPVEARECRIPAACALPAPAGTDLAATVRRWEDQILVGAALGQMKTAFETARRHGKTHKTQGGKPIVAFQEVSFQLAEMLTIHQTARLLATRAAWAAEVQDPDAPMLSDCAKVFVTESAERVASQALQILGSAGLVAGNPVERAARDAKACRILGTSSEIGRVQLGDDALRRWG